MTEPQGLRSLRRCVYLLTALMVLVVMFTIGWIIFIRSNPAPNQLADLVQNNETEPPTTDGSYHEHVRLAPDERLVETEYHDGWMYLRIDGSDNRTRVVTIDVATGAVRGNVTISPD